MNRNLNPDQFGHLAKHEAMTTRAGRTTKGQSVEVAASRRTAVDTEYSPRHSKSRWKK